MKNLKGTRTAENLMKSFAGESQARNRYTYFASIAKKEGYVQISKIFEETANHEKEHAKRMFKFLASQLNGEAISISEVEFPVMYSDTLSNLKSGKAGEHEENAILYPEFAKVAAEEGFPEIASMYTNIAKAEKNHEKRYEKLITELENNTIFKKEEVKLWKCENCGFVYEGKEAPEKCPACLHPKAYFSLQENTY